MVCRARAACEAAFFNESLVYPACRVLLSLDIEGIIFIQAVLHELNHCGRHDYHIAVVWFVIPGNIGFAAVRWLVTPSNWSR